MTGKNSPPRVILICAGEGTRWGNYLGVPKHLVSIDGETLLKRAVRLCLPYTYDVWIVGRDNDPRYKIDGSFYYEAKLNPDNYDADKFLSSKKLWNKKGRTVVLWGDCFFTEEAIKTIMEFKGKDFTLFARLWGSKITGCPWGECFAHSFYPKDLKRHEEALLGLVKWLKEGSLTRCGGWEHYRWMMQAPDIKEHGDYGNRVEIDDFTEDFDTPEDYQGFTQRYFKL